jgi:3-phenylpropionate/trans-cinnamate dioxygenase ferredoxin subunit
MTNPDQFEYVSIAQTDELPDGERLLVEIGQLPIVIFNINNQYYAIANVCSHDDGPLGDGNVDGCEVICPRHGARFDIWTGKALRLPAFMDISVYPVRIQGNDIQVGIPLES